MQTDMIPTAAGPAPADASKPWRTVTEYARDNSITPRTVWNWVDKGLTEVTRRAPRTGVRVRDAT